jgi:glycerol-3-phosphate dehydrogenase
MVHTGLSLYATLGNLRETARFTRVPRREWEQLDGLRTDGLQAVFRYYDGQADDAALTRAVAKSALEFGARLACPASLVSARRRNSAYLVELDLNGTPHELHAKTLVNAAGPWVNRVVDRITPPPARRNMDLVAGTHIEIAGEVEQGIYYTEAPQDQRAVFTMPWQGHTMIGTTEQPFTGDPATVAPTQAEIDYLLAVHAHYFPAAKRELLGAWAGLRVLPHGEGDAFNRPREVLLPVDRKDKPRLVSIYGGKLTGYRLTAEKVMEILAPSLPPPKRAANTREIKLG